MRSNTLQTLTKALTGKFSFFQYALSVLISSQAYGIVGGDLVDSNSAITRSTVAIYDSSNASTCTGTLIAKDLVVTAAHCLLHAKENLTIIFGTDSVATLKSTDEKVAAAFTRKASGIKIHPDFLSPIANHEYGDIGLIKLANDAPKGFTPVAILDSASALAANTPLTLAGYGVFEEKIVQIDRNDPRLEEAMRTGTGYCNNYKTVCKLVVIGHDKKLRQTSVSISEVQSSEMILDETHGHATCYGDSGGPAYITDSNGNLVLAGVNSRGDGSGRCGEATGIKTLISFYVPWIKDTAPTL